MSPVAMIWVIGIVVAVLVVAGVVLTLVLVTRPRASKVTFEPGTYDSPETP